MLILITSALQMRMDKVRQEKTPKGCKKKKKFTEENDKLSRKEIL